METIEIRKSKALTTGEIVEYIPNSVGIKTILKKSTGNISIMSFDFGEGIKERTSPFDTFVQIIDGNADIVISGVSNKLATGESIVIPAHSANYVNPSGRFKMIITTIKSGYDLM